MRLAVLVAAVLAAVVAILAVRLTRPEGTWERIERTRVVRVGYASEEPFAFRAPDGRVTGESPEIARAVFRDLGIERIEWVQTEFQSLVPQLRSGRFDVIASGMIITPERERVIAFSSPTYVAHAALLVRRADLARFRDLEHLRDAHGVRLAMISGGYEGRLVQAAGIDPERLLLLPDAPTGVAAVRSGRVGALAVTAPTARRLAREAPDELAVVIPARHRPAQDGAGGGRGAFAFRQGDGVLRERFDAALREFVGTRAHLGLVRRFGFTTENLPRRRDES